MNFRKILIFNLLFILIIFIFGELIAYAIEFNQLLKENAYKPTDVLKYYTKIVTNYNAEPYYIANFRNPVIIQNSKDKIILLGCSYAYGLCLQDNETLQYQLAKMLKLSVYSLALPSTGLREMLHILRNKEVLNNPKLVGEEKNTQYVIYTYMGDHDRRLFYDLNEHAPHFKKQKNNKLIQLKNKLYYCSFLYRQLKLLQYKYTSKADIDDEFYTYISEINKEIKTNFHNSKNQPSELIIFIYDENVNINWDRISKEEGIKIIQAKDILDVNLHSNEYCISDTDPHPNAKAWEIIVPALAKELKL